MKPIADALGVSRSNLIDQHAKAKQKRSTYRKVADTELLPCIRELVDERPTYGYRRITVLLNRRRISAGEPRVNHKRVYRIMQQNGLLLQPYTGDRIERAHTGKVITLRSNTRWCSDGLEIDCWNGEVVRVAFSLDTCDREAVAWAAGTTGFSGEMIRDIMLLSVERRFDSHRAPHRVEWLSDNGSCYTAKETIDFAKAVGLASKFTPVRSPESNGMSESFVKTFKRDYVRCNPRPDAQTVIAQIDGWFEDYNAVHPHRGLKMLSPHEFIRANSSLAACPV
jgi:putative transposase